MRKLTGPGAWGFKKVLLPAVLCICLNSIAQTGDSVEEKDTTSYFSHIDSTAYNTVQERIIADSVIRRLKSDEAFWYADVNFKKPPPKQNGASGLAKIIKAQWFRTLVWFIIIGAFVAVMVSFLINSNIQLFRKKAQSINNSQEPKIVEDIFSIDYVPQLSKAIKNSNYRLAVRLYYLQLLAHMSEKNIIKYGQDKTNSEYLQQLYNTAYYKDFFTLTRNFEYTCYGQFNVTKEGFELMQKEFSTFNQRMGF